jgi:hypothetical protein
MLDQLIFTDELSLLYLTQAAHTLPLLTRHLSK